MTYDTATMSAQGHGLAPHAVVAQAVDLLVNVDVWHESLPCPASQHVSCQQPSLHYLAAPERCEEK
jgi:hypothetical protein